MENIDWDKAYKIFKRDEEEIITVLKREANRHPRIKEILLILAAGVVIPAVFLMPGFPKALGLFYGQGRGYKKSRFKQTLKRLNDQKLVEVVETKDGPVVKITKNGITKALKYKLEEMMIQRKNNWDKKWRIVIFDIPEEQRKIRDEFRNRLRQLGFFQLQKSVFVHAFHCFDQVEFLRQIYSIDISVTYIVAERIEGEERIKNFFGVN